jgi:hypothetical protein
MSREQAQQLVVLAKKLHTYWAVAEFLLGFVTILSLSLFLSSVNLLHALYSDKFGYNRETDTTTTACANHHSANHHPTIIAYAWISHIVFL